MEEDAIAYFRIKNIGNYALSKPIHRPPLEPKNFLIRLTPEKEKEIEAKKLFKDIEAKCIETETGARFCLAEFDGKKLEFMEMCQPVYEFEVMVKEKRTPNIKECRLKEKNWFLVVKCEPKEFCELK